MNILLISYNFGNTASGIITERVANALKSLGHNVYIISSDSAQGFISFRCKNVMRDSSLFRRVFNKAYSLILGDVPKNYFWVKRAYRQAQSILLNYPIDFVYCRTTPLEACEVGYKLKCKIGIKILLHFTDPQPSEFTIRNSLILKHAIKKYKRIITAADLISFGTDEMRIHQECIFQISLDKKAFVSPDAASSSRIKFLPKKTNSSEIVFVYLGSFTVDRDPYPLIEAFKELRNDGLNVVLNIYSNRPRFFKKNVSFVKFCGRRKDIYDALINADYLVDLDVKHDESVYISSKIKDYLLVNRPILSISKINSPVNRLVGKLSTVFCTENRQDSICFMIKKMIPTSFIDEDYIERQSVVEVFSPNNIARELIEKVSRC